MKRHKSLIPLSRQHHDALILAQLVKRNAPPYKGLPQDINGKREYTLNFFKEKLVPHFEVEELILFPFILGNDKKIDLLVEELIADHKLIADKIEEIRVNKNVEDNLDLLGNLLSSHIRKEERELFQKVQAVLGETKLSKLEHELSLLANHKSC